MEYGLVLNLATNNDCRNLWLWRNNPRVRKNSFDSNIIPWQRHKEWFYSKINGPNTKIYIARKGKDKIGVIRFEIKGNCAKASVSLNPKFFSRGFGTKIIKLGTKNFFRETKIKGYIAAEIKENNLASQKAFVKAGYNKARQLRDRITYKIKRENANF